MSDFGEFETDCYENRLTFHVTIVEIIEVC